MRNLLAILSVCLMVMSALCVITPPARQKDDSNLLWIKVVFGVDGQPADWDGSLSIRGGKLLQLREWQCEARDQVNEADFTWKLRTEIPGSGRVSFAEPQRGILFQAHVTADTSILLKSKQGDFTITPADLVPGRPLMQAAGRVSVEPMTQESVVFETETDDDFTTIAVDRTGHRHVAWVGYDAEMKTDQLLIRDVDDPRSMPQEVAIAEEFSSPHLFAEGDTLRIVWCSPGVERNWDVFTAVRVRGKWEKKRVTTAAGTDFHLTAAQATDGTLWLAWQSFRNGTNGDIYATRLQNGAWGREIAVAATPANEWEPSIAVDSAGSAWVGYDSYQHGNYDVFLTKLTVAGDAIVAAQPLPIARSPDFEAHASVLCDSQDRIWVAYDAAGPNWGKDFRNGPTLNAGKYSEPLHASRRVELRCVVDGAVFEPQGPLPQVLPPDPIDRIERDPNHKPSRFYEFPQLSQDGDGRLWLFFRQCNQGYCAHPPKGVNWDIYATTFTEQGWLEPIQLSRSSGRQNQRLDSTIGPDGRLNCSWSDGNRFASVNRKHVAHVGTLPHISEVQRDLPLKQTDIDAPGVPAPVDPPPWTLVRGSDEFQVCFGDLHRHTNISRCMPTLDGCLTDAHRYALDAVQYDFLCITDHARDVDPFSWWRTQKAADFFHLPGTYVPIYGYERSNFTDGGGHRNVFLLHRGAEINPSDHWYEGRKLARREADPDTTLYPWLKEQELALTAAHTPEYAPTSERGTWTFHDPQVEPIAEIFQALRRSYERPGMGVREEASLWYALKKGYKLGFVASSDHLSTHTSFACVWTKGKNREDIFEALQHRRTYAATDRIALDFRIGDAILGEETTVHGPNVTLSIRAEGTAPITLIEVIRSGKVLATLKPGLRSVRHTYLDEQPLDEDSYYYVRLEQQDGNIAWGSPIWVHRQ